MKVRKATKQRKDFRAFNKLCYRTGYSYEVGKKSDERNYDATIDPPLEYAEYCREIDNADREYYMLVDENKVIGIVTVEGNIVEQFVIGREYQLNGNGRVFYEVLENILRSKGEKEIILSCYYAGSIAFWEKMGFRKNGQFFIKEM